MASGRVDCCTRETNNDRSDRFDDMERTRSELQASVGVKQVHLSSIYDCINTVCIRKYVYIYIYIYILYVCMYVYMYHIYILERERETYFNSYEILKLCHCLFPNNTK